MITVLTLQLLMKPQWQALPRIFSAARLRLGSQDDSAAAAGRRVRGECKRPCKDSCPLSFATRCPQASWASEFCDAANKEAMTVQSSRQQRTAVFVGCNKGMDAINKLRMLSNNGTMDKFERRDAFFEN